MTHTSRAVSAHKCDARFRRTDSFALVLTAFLSEASPAMTIRMMNRVVKLGSWLWCSSLCRSCFVVVFSTALNGCFRLLRFTLSTAEELSVSNFSEQVLGCGMKWALLCRAGDVRHRHHQRRPGAAGGLPSTKRSALVARLDVRDSSVSLEEAEPSSNDDGSRRKSYRQMWRRFAVRLS